MKQQSFVSVTDDLSAIGTVTREKPTLDGDTIKQQTGLMLSSESNEWFTPLSVIDSVRKVLGEINLDPASCLEANEVVRANHIFTDIDDGLNLEWFGNVFCNPPYGKTANKSNQELWSLKAIDEYTKGNVDQCILLLKTAFGYDWLTNVILKSANATHGPTYNMPYMAITKGLLSFNVPQDSGRKAGKAKHATLFIYLGDNPDLFESVFSGFCFVVQAR